MPPSAGGGRRELPYEALDPEWEAREFQKFRAAAGGGRQQAPYGAYLFGRLMQSDLHQSCRPALPPDVEKLDGSTIQGVCILQVVDVANIGANYEHRTEFSAAGPARTLKLGLTDGHQLVFGFEFTPLPQFSVNVARGTKIVVENVPVRHGLLLLAPDNCQLLETTTDQPTRVNGQVQQTAESNGVSAGAYSAALVTSQFNASEQQSAPEIPPTRPQPPAAGPHTTTTAPNSAGRINAASSTTPSNVEPARRTNTNSTVGSANAWDPSRSSAIPSVFVDVPSSDEDMDSDTTDPMVEHLFYSPKTPRIPNTSSTSVIAPTTTSSSVPSKKRPRSPSADWRIEAARTPHNAAAPLYTTTTVDREIVADRDSTPSSAVRHSNITSTPASATISPPLDPTRPFQYFTARLPALSVSLLSTTSTRFQIRACIKSVVGFQFNTGRYQLRVSVEDCTATKEADVAEDFVARLMGVPCSEFLQTMQTKVQVAHGWAANMQFALMKLEGVMTFEKSAAASAAGTAPLLLIDCRDFQSSDTRDLLQRVKASLSRAPR
ncbi:hypothetical protein PF005_g6488 [Phytophthora fragariae]|uniref:RecQ-mediated genome instability protein 1 n=1 Tax=Phytophthora fragariae TaxID=53985 RepID=A0A6A4E9D8_9STRA|nr:hypothetical protein PF003_g19059 [Phytophthora fragariae]KAE8943035.1 hypothetical protein PF009_g7227 [Phytophthora fragariae]KAE9020326.1 hypothetical protein PF011_g5464 [Phytophthora fragariae]KAE9124337.1 hypothetical protein PF007_g6763 [Phytophthora fragariae]KAE9125124.1 hypothetical protein PF010_g5750 [Phytophthora fragariae]